jgi:hypothetical protein
MAPEANPASARGAWYPLLGEWQERRMHWLRLFRDGLAAAGAEVRVDTVGTPGRELSLLWVRSPEPLVEGAEQWLLRLQEPADERGEKWAVIDTLLVQRWREFTVCSGTRTDYEEWSRPLFESPFAYGPRIASYAGPSPITAFAFPRSTVTVLEMLAPRWSRIGPPPMSELHEWVALDQCGAAEDMSVLIALERGLQDLGVTTCRYEAAGGRVAILAVHVGTGSLDDFEAQVAEKTAGSKPPWLGRYRPWSWTCGVQIHRAQGAAGWDLRARLERALGGPVDAVGSPDGEVTLTVPPRFAARALELLRELDAAT